MTERLWSLYEEVMRWLERIRHRVGAALCILYPTIIPKGIAERWKYRMLMSLYWYVKFMAIKAGQRHNSDVKRIQTARYLRKLLTPPLPPDPAVNVKVTTLDGIPVRLHEPNNRGHELLPGFIYFHGGGMVLGSSEAYESVTRILCSRLNAVVISVDYRLAPEHIFPAAYDDSLKASKWILQNGERFGIDVNRVAMGGDSAGGYLTTLMTQALRREKDLPKVKVQILVYPNVQFFDICTPSYQKCHKIFGDKDGVLPNIAVPDFMSMYIKGESEPRFLKAALANLHVSAEFKKSDLYRKRLNVSRLLPAEHRQLSSYYEGPVNEENGSDDIWNEIEQFMMDRRFSPLIEEDFSDLPPALIQTCGFDSLHDDGVIYANRLKEAGVEVKSVNYQDGFHGIFSYQGSGRFATANKMMDEVISFTKQNL
ncbi:arylacetamide deacetylase-like [Apostichopus japonicus]|uniref:arylacetamide deacetylase-like n=1 Tax=Stichopus japonicus TaxID=307972 RepID=UPI003AB4BCEF